MSTNFDPQRMMQLQQVAQQWDTEIKSLEEQHLAAERIISDMNKTSATLKGLKDPDNEQDVMIPIGSGVYLEGKITNWQRIHVNVGSGTIVPKSLDEALELLDEQMKNYRGLIGEITKTIQDKVMQIQQIENELRKMQGNFGVAPET